MALARTSAPPLGHSIREISIAISNIQNDDADLRFMALEDLNKSITASATNLFVNERQIAQTVMDTVLRGLDDSNGDVQSAALKCLAPLGVRMSMQTAILFTFFEKLTALETTKSQDQTIVATAARYLVASLPRPVSGVAPSPVVSQSYGAISGILIPRLLGTSSTVLSKKGQPPPAAPAILGIDEKRGARMDAIDLCNEVIRCFGPLFKETETSALLKRLMEIVEGEPTGVVGKKKAVAAVAQLTNYLPEEMLSSFVTGLIESLTLPHLTAVRRRLLITLIGSVVRAVPREFGKYLQTIAPFFLAALSKDEHDQLLEDRDDDGSVSVQSEEVREAALTTLEDSLSSCVNEMRAFTDEALEACICYLSYDPSVVMDADMDDDEDEDTEFDDGDEEEYEQEEGLDEIDDSSWKVRRCAVKALSALIFTRSSDLMDSGVLYERIAPFLIKRFSEREENVRAEILDTCAMILKRTADITAEPMDVAVEEATSPTAASLEHSRKRRRGESDAGMNDTSYSVGVASPGLSPLPTSGPRAEVARFGPSLVQAATKALNSKDLPTKLSSVGLLTEYSRLSPGGLKESLEPIMESTITILGVQRSNTGLKSSSSALGNALRIEALKFLLAICETHSSKNIAPFLGSIVPAVISSVDDRYFKIACQALETAEGVLKVLTPPRSLGSDGKHSIHVKTLFDIICHKAKANDTDQEVRQKAIHALGVCFVRTSAASSLLSTADRTEAFSVLENRLKNETTRLASVEAIDAIATFSDSKTNLDPDWIRSVAVELSNNMRKADMRVRTTSLAALRKIVTNLNLLQGFDAATVEVVANSMISLLDSANVGSLNAACTILARLVEKAPSQVVQPALNEALCSVLTASVTGSALINIQKLLEVIGRSGMGEGLMQDLLKKVGVNGEATAVGSAIGTLMVTGQVSVGIDEVSMELDSGDDARKCLALCILGEIALRHGSQLPPQMFLAHLHSKSDQVARVAAICLGRAGAGYPDVYFPVIMETLKTNEESQPLLLHSVKEILQYTSRAKVDAIKYADAIWEDIVSISSMEGNETIGAECIGRLLAINPKKLLPSLQSYLKGPVARTRGLVIQALRFAFGAGDDALDIVLRPVLIDLLTTMLQDSDVENRRLALTTLNSALKHKPSLIIGNIQQVLPIVLESTMIDDSLIKEVQMGPFKHRVDEGLENRKSAYETLYAFTDVAYHRMGHPELYERVVEGFGDDYDIKTINHLILSRLLTLDPGEVGRRLDALAPHFQQILTLKLKDNAVKQEHEKQQEAIKDVLRACVRLQVHFAEAAAGGSPTPKWGSLVDMLERDFKPQLMAVAEQLKTQA